MNDFQIILLQKKKNDANVNETVSKLELTKMTYSEIFNDIMYNIDDADLLITNKIGYNIRYDNIVKVGKFRMITFSDSKIIYPNKESPSFYSYYLMHNKKELGKTINKLIDDKSI